MKALTIRQPYAQLVAIGAKTIETRGRRTNYRGPILIHAAAKWTVDQFVELLRSGNGPAIADALEAAGHAEPHTEPRQKGPYPGGVYYFSTELVHDLPLGAVVAAAQIVGCLPIVEAVPIGQHDRDEMVVQYLTDNGAGEERLCLLRREPRGGESLRDLTDQLPFGDFTPGRWAWLLDDIRPLPEPVPARGKQGLWTPTEDERARIAQQLEAVTP